jgi:hypothetical protein
LPLAPPRGADRAGLQVAGAVADRDRAGAAAGARARAPRRSSAVNTVVTTLPATLLAIVIEPALPPAALVVVAAPAAGADRGRWPTPPVEVMLTAPPAPPGWLLSAVAAGAAVGP